MEEIWKPIKDNENYTISNYGKVKNDNMAENLEWCDRKYIVN